ncbi:MAG TPA: ComEA family DNA-binding protein [Actinomycetes bacterium]|nr:ComEA family DNA-binding protein [Actinomycetes bacterium]
MHPQPPFVQPRDGWRGRLDVTLAALGRHARLTALAVLATTALAWLVWTRATPRPEPDGLPPGPAASTGPAVARDPAPGGEPAGGARARLAVHVAGRVRRGGLITLPAGSRVADALAAAGGAAPGADLDRLNLARHLTDGEQVLVPTRGAPAPATGPGAEAPGGTPTGPVPLNTATAEQLDTLPGVGAVTAERIVAYRSAHPFRSVEELQQVPGIGERRYATLKDLVTVG